MNANTVPAAFARGDEVELAERLLESMGSLENLVSDEDALYRYRDGLWQIATPHEMSRIVQCFAGAPLLKKKTRLVVNARNVKGALELALERVSRPGFFSAAPLGLTFSNGFLTIEEDGKVRLTPHTREQRQRVGYAFPWLEDEKPSEAFLAFVQSFFRGDEDADDKVRFIQEVFGASLVGAATKYQRCALLIGDGENGKDTLIDVLKSVFPDNLIASISPHKWDAEYYRAGLAGKRLNVIGELPKKDLDESESFKAFVTGSRVDARVTFGRVFFFTPTAGHIFAANAVMGTSDFSHGFYRRFGIVRFNRTFEGEERDPGIRARLIAAGAGQIVAWLVLGASALISRNGFILPRSHFEELVVWEMSVDTVAAFFDTLFPGGEMQASVLYEQFQMWCQANGHKAVSSTKFGSRVKALLKKKRWPESRRGAAGVLYPVSLKRLVQGGSTRENVSNILPFKPLV